MMYRNRCYYYKPDKETALFVLFFVGMAVYYGWRMFGLTPWYDELYTYYFFISRGPVYAAIHWPLPNNHIGYSVLSACLGIFGNSAIALRGISYLCSLGSLILLFRIARRCFRRGMALIPVFLYTGMKLVNQLAVQGRGYALVTFCYLVAIWELLQITVECRNRIRDYIVFGISLVLALYAIPSSLYVVVPVCLTGGVMLLVRGEYRRLACLIITSIASAACTVGLYGVVWLAIGSNLLMKTEGSSYYGMGHGTIIFHAPFEAMKTGITYMLATPYIQSVGRDGFMGKFISWLCSLLNEYYEGGSMVLTILLILCGFWVLSCIGKRLSNMRYDKMSEEEATYDSFIEFYLAVSLLGIPLMLVILCSLPYYRVFSFAGVAIAFALTWLLQMLVERFGCRFGQGKLQAEESVQTAKNMQLDLQVEASVRGGRHIKSYLPWIGSGVAGVMCVILLLGPSYRTQYSDREAAIEDACRQIDLSQVQKVAITDCDQEYLLLFLYNIDGEQITRDLAEAEVVLADKYLLLNYDTDVIDWSADGWKMYLTQEEFAASNVTERMEAVYENDRFILYQDKTKGE